MDNTLFQKNLRNALNHLYDLDYLRHSPLVGTFNLSNRFDPGGTLQKMLIDAIEIIRPAIGDSPLSDQRKTYEILNFRYVQQFKQAEVAHHLGLSERQFRREQDSALDFLANELGKKFNLQTPEEKAPSPEPSSSVNLDWSWVTENHTAPVTGLGLVIEDILVMMQPVAASHQARLAHTIPADLPGLKIHPVALRQIILNLIQVSLLHAENGQVEIDGSLSEKNFIIQFSVRSSLPVAIEQSGQEENLSSISTNLARLCGCQIHFDRSEHSFEASLSIPVVDDIPVLVVDDNPEILDLLVRYSIGSSYQVHPTSQVDSVIELAGQIQAQVIVLDVMMPRRDGWEILGRVRNHPKTAHIPVIILTILAQEELARSLGAHCLVMKPVTQERFLAALDDALAKKNSTPR